LSGRRFGHAEDLLRGPSGRAACRLCRTREPITDHSGGRRGTVNGLKQRDDFFGYSANNPGPSVLTITVNTAREFVKKRKAEGVGNAVINRSLACLRRMLSIAQEDGKIQNVPIIRLQKEPPARRGFRHRRPVRRADKTLTDELASADCVPIFLRSPTRRSAGHRMGAS